MRTFKTGYFLYRLLFIIFLGLGSAQADERVIIGAGAGWVNEDFSFTNSQGEKTVGSSAAIENLKIGYGDIKKYAITFTVSYSEYSQNLFSLNDGSKMNLDIDLIKSFDLNSSFIPFVSMGMGVGHMTVERELENYVEGGSFQVGTGLYYQIAPYMDLELNIQYKWAHWTSLDFISTKPETSSTSLLGTLGVNFRF